MKKATKTKGRGTAAAGASGRAERRPARESEARQAAPRRPAGARERAEPDEMRPEYDFSGGVRGKYAARFAEGTNLVRLDADVAAAFPDSEAVNDALRALVRIASRPRRGAASRVR